MTPEYWQKIEELFNQAVERRPGEREAFLAQSCAGDDDLRREVESLLAQEIDGGKFIVSAIHEIAVELPTAAINPPDVNFETNQARWTQTPPTRLMPGSEHENYRELIGRRIGVYNIEGLIGHGGMGTVYRAGRGDDQFQQQVALKIVKRGMDTEFVLKRFRHERQILARLEHPHIARLLDGGATEAGLPYFVMEYIEGRPITKYCEENDLSIRERLNLFRLVCTAVQYAHQNLVIHRDLKPGNILVTKDGVPKLLDFGVAKLLEPDPTSDAATQTDTAMRLMTPDYASPEQALGLPVTTASDVYSLGVVLYELLTGERPHRFKNYSPLEIERAVRETETEKPSQVVSRNPQAPARLSKQLAGDLDNIVLTALRKEPERRYASVEQLSEDLRRYLEGRPVLARQDHLSYRAGKFVRRNKLAVGAAVLIGLSLLGGVAATAVQARRADEQARRAERRFQQVRKLANTFLFEIHDRIESLSGSTETRELLVKTALEYLDSLAQEAAGDPALQLELANAYLRVGNVQGDLTSANLGQVDAAGASYRKALTLTLAARDENNTEYWRVLCETYLHLGQQSDEAGRLTEGIDLLQRGLAAAQQANERKPGQLTELMLLIKLHERLGDLELKARKIPVALGHYRQTLKYVEQRAAQFPGKAARANLALIHSRVGDAQAETGDLAGTLASYQKSVDFHESLVRENPSNATLRREMDEKNPGNAEVASATHAILLNLADLLLETGEHKTALEHYRQALELSAAASANSADLYARWRLADAQAGLAHYYETLAVDSKSAKSAKFERLANWRAARDWRQQSLETWDGWSRQAKSSVFDQTRREQAARLLARCNAELTRLKSTL